jgi:hypothetical protein
VKKEVELNFDINDNGLPKYLLKNLIKIAKQGINRKQSFYFTKYAK